jgi:hypothetical protein
MQPLGAKENVDQTQILGVAVGEPLMTSNDEYVARCHEPGGAVTYTQRVASHNDHDLTGVACRWINPLLRIVSMNSDRKGTEMSAVFYVGDRHGWECNWSVTY